MNESKHFHHDPSQFLRPQVHNDWTNTSLIILNQPIASRQLLQRLWTHSTHQICADGGANRLHDLLAPFNKFPDLRDKHVRIATCNHSVYLNKCQVPQEIVGDLDSLLSSVQHFYTSRNVTFYHDADQDSTDFQKSVRRCCALNPGLSHILILGTIAGRVDQGIGLLSEIYREQTRRPDIRIYLFSEQSISFILDAGTSDIATPLSQGLLMQNIGILPIYGPAVITTSGLEWDVTDWKTSMGDQVSTSNHVMQDKIQITTTHPVLFTIERNTDVNRHAQHDS